MTLPEGCINIYVAFKHNLMKGLENMSSPAYSCMNTKSEEELVQEQEPSHNYAGDLGKIGQALRKYRAEHPEYFHRTGTAFNAIEDVHE